MSQSRIVLHENASPTSGSSRPAASGLMVSTGFFESWLTPFHFAVGFFVLAMFAYLAAVYLILETQEDDLREGFRRKALGSAVAVGALAFVCLGLTFPYAPVLQKGLLQRWWSLPFHLLTGALSVGALWALWTRRYRWARLLAPAQIGMVSSGEELHTYAKWAGLSDIHIHRFHDAWVAVTGAKR